MCRQMTAWISMELYGFLELAAFSVKNVVLNLRQQFAICVHTVRVYQWCFIMLFISGECINVGTSWESQLSNNTRWQLLKACRKLRWCHVGYRVLAPSFNGPFTTHAIRIVHAPSDMWGCWLFCRLMACWSWVLTWPMDCGTGLVNTCASEILLERFYCMLPVLLASWMSRHCSGGVGCLCGIGGWTAERSTGEAWWQYVCFSMICPCSDSYLILQTLLTNLSCLPLRTGCLYIHDVCP